MDLWIKGRRIAIGIAFSAHPLISFPMISFLRREWLPLLLSLFPLGLLLAVWPQLPERVPVHFNLSGEADGWSEKGPALFLIPGLMIGIYLLLTFLRRIDPKKPEFSATSLMQIKTGLLLFLGAIFGYVTYIQLHEDQVVSSNMLLYLILALFVFLGNMMGKMRPSYFLGIRTPWTLESEAVWVRTHRLAGRIWVFGSLALMAVLWALPESAAGMLFTGAILVFVAVPVGASWWFSRESHP
jgi:uncharacterized membrane protein